MARKSVISMVCSSSKATRNATSVPDIAARRLNVCQCAQRNQQQCAQNLLLQDATGKTGLLQCNIIHTPFVVRKTLLFVAQTNLILKNQKKMKKP